MGIIRPEMMLMTRAVLKNCKTAPEKIKMVMI